GEHGPDLLRAGVDEANGGHRPTPASSRHGYTASPRPDRTRSCPSAVKAAWRISSCASAKTACSLSDWASPSERTDCAGEEGPSAANASPHAETASAPSHLSSRRSTATGRRGLRPTSQLHSPPLAALAPSGQRPMATKLPYGATSPW